MARHRRLAGRQEAPAPAPEAGDHSDGAAAVPVAWPVAVLAAAGVAAVMMV